MTIVYKLLAITTLSITIMSCSDSNSMLEYGETGLPANCRAIITENIKAYQELRHDHLDYELQLLYADDIMESIDRNCGAYGSEWNN